MSRIRFLILTFGLPMVLGYSMIILAVVVDFFGPREFTYQTVHLLGEEQVQFDRLKTQVESWDAGDPRVQRVSLDAYEHTSDQCEGRLVALGIVFHATVGDPGVHDLHGALIRDAYAMGLGRQCGGMRATMDSMRSVEGRGWLMPMLLAPLSLVIVAFNWISRRGRRPLWLNWADWQPRVGWVKALRLGAGYGVVALLVVMALGALAGLAGWLEDKPQMSIALEHWPWLIFASFFAPILEEFIYRAWLLERLTRAMRDSTALLVSTAAFAAVHVPSSIFEWSNFFLVGLVYGLLWLRTRSLLAVSIAHGLYNGLLLAAQMLLAG